MSMAPPRMYELVERVKERLAGVSEEVVVAGYGHYGDGNLHLNVSDGRRGLQQVGTGVPWGTVPCQMDQSASLHQH